mmetsp:Transcript_3761/g.8726  ORF Transcript_3761/g.8726 Transcript_3761/m.8726 type:complete len:122 (-) Transcript_3761:1943-2308(-)
MSNTACSAKGTNRKGSNVNSIKIYGSLVADAFFFAMAGKTKLFGFGPCKNAKTIALVVMNHTARYYYYFPGYEENIVQAERINFNRIRSNRISKIPSTEDRQTHCTQNWSFHLRPRRLWFQ